MVLLNTEITFTIGGLLTGFLTICAGISVVGGAFALVLRAIKHFKAPEESQNQRLDAVEEEQQRHRDFLASDKRRLDALEEGDRLTKRAILALLRHAIDGNEVDALRRSEQELHDYLLNK